MSFVYDNFDFPDEFLRDSSYWMSVDKMESFLFICRHYYELEKPDANLLEEVGANCHELRAWGALDSVLRMMTNPIDIFAQPDRFLSYFVSPVGPITGLTRDKSSVSFRAPLSSEEYPLITSYLRSAFESLPQFVGKRAAQVKWQGYEFCLSYESEQPELFDEVQNQVSPDLLQSIITTLQESQKALEVKNRELAEKNQQLMERQKAVETQQVSFDPTAVNPLNGNLQKMKDYFTRANQLVTLLVGQDRLSRQVQEAMRRVDWEYTSQEFPRVVEESLHLIRQAPITNTAPGGQHERNP